MFPGAEYAFCSNRGTCDFSTGLCSCLDGFGGPACSNITYLHHHGSNTKPGLEVSVSGLDYVSTALQISSARSASSEFNFIEASSASETVFYVDGTGGVGINKLRALTGGIRHCEDGRARSARILEITYTLITEPTTAMLIIGMRIASL